MLRLLGVRFIGCAAALTAGCLLFGKASFSPAVLLWALLLAALYAVVKPLYSMIVLPFDMFLCGLGTLCLDALMIKIAVPYGFAYWQALAIAAAIAVCFVPYEWMREKVSL